MIKANELRIGNWMYDKRTRCNNTVNASDFNDVFINGNVELVVEFFNPIELTPEILNKCGFQKQNRSYKLKNFGKFIYHDSIEKLSFYPAGLLGSLLRKDFIKYLHQLQNLYYALTGEELEVKL